MFTLESLGITKYNKDSKNAFVFQSFVPTRQIVVLCLPLSAMLSSFLNEWLRLADRQSAFESQMRVASSAEYSARNAGQITSVAENIVCDV